MKTFQERPGQEFKRLEDGADNLSNIQTIYPNMYITVYDMGTGVSPPLHSDRFILITWPQPGHRIPSDKWQRAMAKKAPVTARANPGPLRARLVG